MTPEETAAAAAQAQQAEAFKKIASDVFAELIKPVNESTAKVTEALTTLTKNQEVIANTLKDLPPAPKPGEKKTGDPDPNAPKLLTLEDINRVLDERDNKRQATAEQTKAREAFINDPKNGIAKLAPEFKARLGSDPEKWAAEAAATKVSWETFAKENKIPIADVGGANREGGDAGGADASKTVNTVFLPENTAKQAAAIKIGG